MSFDKNRPFPNKPQASILSVAAITDNVHSPHPTPNALHSSQTNDIVHLDVSRERYCFIRARLGDLGNAPSSFAKRSTNCRSSSVEAVKMISRLSTTWGIWSLPLCIIFSSQSISSDAIRSESPINPHFRNDVSSNHVVVMPFCPQVGIEKPVLVKPAQLYIV
jgi:hypothetical protein